jgi:hypothetical protein
MRDVSQQQGETGCRRRRGLPSLRAESIGTQLHGLGEYDEEITKSMSVTVIWEARFAQEKAEPGRRVMQRIWNDMLACGGYLDHELVTDVEDAGHIVVVSHWASREAR